MSKRKVTVTLDEDLVDLHKIKSIIPLSTDLNNYLKESLMVSDELEEVNKQIEKHEKSLNILRPKQARLEQLKVIEANNQNNYEAVYDTLVRMEESNGGFIGRNQLRLVAEVRKVDYDGLVQYCLDHDFEVVNVAGNDVKKHANWRV